MILVPRLFLQDTAVFTSKGLTTYALHVPVVVVVVLGFRGRGQADGLDWFGSVRSHHYVLYI